MSLARILFAVGVIGGILHAQTQADATVQPAFEMASVKAMPSGTRLSRSGPSVPGRYSDQATLQNFVARAYQVGTDQVKGPGWTGTEMYSVEANIPEGATQEQLSVMLRNLLSERFQMTVHRETDVVDGYDLVVAEGGPKLKEVAPSVILAQSRGRAEYGPSGITVICESYGMSSFASELGAFRLGNPQKLVRVIDKTGLRGAYDFILHYDYVGGPGRGTGDATRLDIFAALEGQLGLRWQPAKITLDMMVIDHAEEIPVESQSASAR